jgi:hypothetical protein
VKFDQCQSGRAIKLSRMAKFKCPRFAVLVCGLQSLSRVVISGGQPSPAISEHLAKTHDARLADAWPRRRGAIINTLNHVSPFQRLTRPSCKEHQDAWSLAERDDHGRAPIHRQLTSSCCKRTTHPAPLMPFTPHPLVLHRQSSPSFMWE